MPKKKKVIKKKPVKKTPKKVAKPPKPKGAFTYDGQTLYTMNVTLRGGRKQDIYFFSKKKPKRGHPTAKPAGMVVRKNKRNRQPYLKRLGAKPKPKVKAKPKKTVHKKKTVKKKKVVHKKKVQRKKKK